MRAMKTRLAPTNEDKAAAMLLKGISIKVSTPKKPVNDRLAEKASRALRQFGARELLDAVCFSDVLQDQAGRRPTASNIRDVLGDAVALLVISKLPELPGGSTVEVGVGA